jgi:ribosomal-protein-alanine N-acetyltransferase
MPERENLRLLLAAPAHAGEIAVLHTSLFERGWDIDGVRRLLEHPACLAYVAVDATDNTVLGYIVAHLAAGEGEILSLGVNKGRHRQGMGRRLAQTLIDTAKRKDIQRLFLDVAESNAAALALYAQLGFTQIGRRKAYYLHADGTREDALLMALALSTARPG